METEGSETILLVEGDALQRSTVARYLRDCGYRVIEATNTAEARQALARFEVTIVVTDVNLRDASGFELSSIVRQQRPGVRVFLTHSVEKTAKLAGDLCDDGPLDHPYHPQHLVERIRRMRGSQS
ncbi:response regulator [Rhizobium sp. XQZ8]|uniref:response regulator transcription factor n=1 Tax=Rhizobium populisoli TaxID=2859785 RepID=UPI001C6852E6|nr:response regulator [Rhizobium populisoli]